MAAQLERQQLVKLCFSSDTLQLAHSLLRLAKARTRPGSGFVVSTIALPAACAYLASERLNTSELSLQTAQAAACVAPAEFADILKKLRAALNAEEHDATTDVTYAHLVDAYRLQPRTDVIACMEDTQSSLPRFDMLRERYGTKLVTCAVFYLVCQLMEEPAVRERSFCQTYSLHPQTFKSAVSALDKQCDGIADQIKSHLLQKRSAASPQKSPVKSVMRTRLASSTPSKKRAVVFSQLPSAGNDNDDDDDNAFPETPTKKRRIVPPTAHGSATKHPPASATAAFHAALTGSPAKQTETNPSSALPGPSTPRRSRHATMAPSDPAAIPLRTDSQHPMTPSQSHSQSPSRSQSQGQASLAVPSARRRRFRPIFLEQQQWCERDPKVDRLWAAARALQDEALQSRESSFQVGAT